MHHVHDVKDGGAMAAKHPVRSTCAREAGNSAAEPIGHGRVFIACHITLFKNSNQASIELNAHPQQVPAMVHILMGDRVDTNRSANHTQGK